MADAVLKPQQSKPTPTPRNFPSHFLLRALIAFFFFIVIPILPSIAPDFLNLNLLSQSWELLHIVFVGIAVSYGLLSRRYTDSSADPPPKSDSPHSYVSRLLQASSVFDDDVDSPTSDDGGSHSKIQTWSSQYFRNEPVVVVANEKQIGSVISDADHKPLLLPVRSLKSRVSDDSSLSRVYPRSNSEPPNWSSDSKSELESVVLPSPIPWRSRSGRLEKKKKENDDDDLVVHHLHPMESKRSEDLPIKKAIYRSPPPPPPPPPPPMALFSTSSSAVKSCRTVSSRSWKEDDDEEKEDLNGDDFLGEVEATSDYDDDDDVDEVDEVKGSVEEMENGREEGVGSCSTDVDKKADEFIAKFREQIRLQRIESIKRSTVQFSRSNGE